MNFVALDVGRRVMTEMQNAAQVRLAVAYFSPDAPMLTALCKVPKLTLVISEEFTINDPYKLEQIPSSATLRSVPSDCENGKLHAKVLIVRRPDRSKWALVGSANMTWQGLFSNQEACLALDSQNPADSASLKEIESWFGSLLATARCPDLKEAKKIFNSRSLYRLERRPAPAHKGETTACYWALKATSGSYGEDQWPNFLTEGVIGIGWPGIDVNPAMVDLAALRKAVEIAYPTSDDDPDQGEGDPHGAAIKIKKFIDLHVGDIVLICKGYPAVSGKPVHIRGFARVTGPFRDDEESTWDWRFKHDAVIQAVDLFLPKEIVAKALGKGSLRGTIHKLNQDALDHLVQALDVPLKV